MKKYGITGHTGLIGKNFINSKKIKFIKFKGNILKKNDIRKWIIKNPKIDGIIHLAGIVPIYKVSRNFSNAKKINFYGTKFLVDEIIKSKINLKWFFFSSSAHVYQIKNKKIKIKEKSKLQPFTKYGLTKLLAEKYIISKFNKAKIPYCIGRIFNILHTKQPKGFFYSDIISKVKNNNKKIITFNNLNHYRDFLSPSAVSKFIILLLKKNASGIFNIGSGKGTNLEELVKIICKKYNKKFKIKQTNKYSYLIADVKKLLTTTLYKKYKKID